MKNRINFYDTLLSMVKIEFKDNPNVYTKVENIFSKVLNNSWQADPIIKNLHLLKFYICEIFNIYPETFKSGPSKKKELVLVRQLFCYLAKEYFGSRYTLAYITDFCTTGQDHSIAFHNINTFKGLIKVNDHIAVAALKKWEDGIKAYGSK